MANAGEQQVQVDSDAIRRQVADLITNYEAELKSDDLRPKVLALIPIFHGLRDLGKSLVPEQYTKSARDRMLFYFSKYPGTVIQGDELLVVSGIQDYPRRIRELRVQFGWAIASGVTMREVLQEEHGLAADALSEIRPDDYVLLDSTQDRDAAHRWNTANAIRRGDGSVQSKVLSFLRQNVGRPVTGEELRYVADGKGDWPRRVRELRTEYGWPIVTKTTGRPDLPIGVYLLETDRQSPEHDRHIPDDIRGEVLRRDAYQCKECSWTHELWNRSDPRHLELHHITHHVMGGPNVAENLRTLCTTCHDRLHREDSGNSH